MDSSVPHFDDEALQRLDGFLLSDNAPEESMGLSDLDGFLTAIAIGPDLVKPSEWFPEIWGGGSPDFDDTEQAQTITNAIMGRYNEILHSLEQGPDIYQPIFWATEDGTAIPMDWAEGFYDGMVLRREQWLEMMDEDEVRQFIAPIMFLNDAEKAEEISQEAYATLVDEAAESIPFCVVQMNQYWKAKRS